MSNEPKAILLKTTRQKTRQHLINIYFNENQSEMNLKSKDAANLVATVFRKESKIANQTNEPNDLFYLIVHLFHNINKKTEKIRLKSVSVQDNRPRTKRKTNKFFLNLTKNSTKISTFVLNEICQNQKQSTSFNFVYFLSLVLIYGI